MVNKKDGPVQDFSCVTKLKNFLFIWEEEIKILRKELFSPNEEAENPFLQLNKNITKFIQHGQVIMIKDEDTKAEGRHSNVQLILADLDERIERLEILAGLKSKKEPPSPFKVGWVYDCSNKFDKFLVVKIMPPSTDSILNVVTIRNFSPSSENVVFELFTQSGGQWNNPGFHGKLISSSGRKWEPEN